MQDIQQRSSQRQITTDKPTVIISADGDFVAANEAGADIQGYSREKMVTLNITDTLRNPCIENGRQLEQALNGETVEAEVEITKDDGTPAVMSVVCTPVSIDGEKHVRSQVESIEEVEVEESEPMTFSDIPNDTLSEITRNIRIDAATEMSLGEAMADIAAAQNELEQYKNGALTLHAAIDERLREEEERNPGSVEAKVLRGVKESAFKVYERTR